jgi:tetratricopeptide (TPR) repeat protein
MKKPSNLGSARAADSPKSISHLNPESPAPDEEEVTLYDPAPLGWKAFLLGVWRYHPTQRAAAASGWKAVLLGVWRYRWLLAITITLLTLIFWVIPAGFMALLERLERRQSRKLTAMATEYLKEGKIDEMRMGLATALKLNPENAEALRLMARLQMAQGSNAEALDAMRQLTETGQLSFADLRSYAILAAREGYPALAERLVNSASRGGNTVLRHLLRAQVNEAKNDPAGVEKELREAVAVDESGEAGMYLARFLTSRRLNAQTAPEILEILRKTSGRKEQMGAEALALGISSGVVPPAEMAGWISSLRSHPKVSERGLILADEAEMRVRPETKSQVVDQLAKRLQGKPLLERLQGMALAIQVGEPQTAVSLINPTEAASYAGIFQMWLDALAVQNRWAEILDVLGREGQPLPEYQKGLYTGRALVALGKTAEGQRAYGKALEEAFPKREEFLVAVAYLGQAGEDDLFEQGLRKALEDAEGRTEVMKAVVPAVAGRLDAARTRRIYEIAAALPGAGEDLILQNDLDYLSLVLGQPVDVRVLAERSRANPRDFSFRVTHALALLRAGNAKQALQELEDCEPDVVVESLVPSQRMVVASALAAAGKTREAEYVAATILPASLSGQEAAFLMEQLGKALPAQNGNGG